MANRSREGHLIFWEIDDVTARRIVECLLKGGGLSDGDSRYDPRFRTRYLSIAEELGDKLDALPKPEKAPKDPVAMKYDGTAISAQAILPWLSKHHGSAVLQYNTPRAGSNNRFILNGDEVPPGHWIVLVNEKLEIRPFRHNQKEKEE